ncbi:hypothetical protein D043_2427A, partial [Vibrio parahaemolyticus EKP-021]
MLLAVQATLV